MATKKRKTEGVLSEKEKLEKYKESIEFLASENIDYPIPNHNEDHAAIIIESIIKHSKNRINIYCKNLNGLIMSKNKLFESLKNFLREGGEVRIVSDDPSDCHKAFKDLNDLNDNLKISKSSEAFKDLVKNKIENVEYFFLGDTRMSRLEYNNTNHAAICNFGSSSEVKRVLDVVGQLM